MADVYGADVSTFPDLDVRGVQIREEESVAECCLRRLGIDNGSISYDKDAGFNLRDLLNEDLSDSDLRRNEVRAAMECEKDERVRSATVSMTLDAATFTLKVRIRGVLVSGRTFALTAAISKVSVELFRNS